jgi:hypothetical protein
MALIDKIKVVAVLDDHFKGKEDATPVSLTYQYIEDNPDFNSEFTMEEQMEEMFLDFAIAQNKIQKILDDNPDIDLKQ